MIIVKTPGINDLGKNKGCRDAGNKIIEKLEEVYSSEAGKPIDKKLLNIEEIHVDNNNVEEQENLIYENSLEILQNNDKCIFLGGDHSISFSIGKGFLEYCKKEEKEPCLIVFDAHADCMEPMKEATHEEWLRKLIEFGFPVKNILLVGVRNIWKQEISFLAKNKIKTVSMNSLNNNLEEVTDVVMEFASGKQLYVSFDIDVIDPVFASSTGYSEPGGLSSRQATYIVSRIAKMKNLKAFDIIEVDVVKDKPEFKTVKLASKLLGELL